MKKNTSYWLSLMPEGERGTSCTHLQEPPALSDPSSSPRRRHTIIVWERKEAQQWDGRWPDSQWGSAAHCFPTEAFQFVQKSFFLQASWRFTGEWDTKQPGYLKKNTEELMIHSVEVIVTVTCWLSRLWSGFSWFLLMMLIVGKR